MSFVQERARALGWDLLVTSIFRTPFEDKQLKGSGVHSAWRALDIRTLDVPAEKVTQLTDEVNKTFQYDPNRTHLPVAYSKMHGNAPHLHIQVTHLTGRK